jgi:HSP20 family molecular chaperone IbpA
MVRIHYQKPKIFISEIDRHRFEESIRIFAIVENRGRSMARYVKPLLTVEDNNLSELVYAEYSNLNNKWISCSKGDSICTICNKDGRGFLSPHPFKVEKDYLCWTVPEIDAGFGLNNRRYCHVTNIAPNDSQKVIIGDVYRNEEGKTCVIKIADEYGIDWKPRICYRVDLNKDVAIRFTLELVGEGFDPVKENIELKIARGELRIRLRRSEKLISEFKDIRRFPLSFTLPSVR